MKLLLEATLLFGENTNYTTSNFQKLMELRQVARGDEARRIGELVEKFISQSPPDVMKQIMSMI
ncbi:hypothetical protein [Pseudanabaena sp. FACHB-2040]|uniref:hypothetical protein n=1 Tax=Pseudanabaena sp. FACHB-2040 TaxID=2692859 RepID=UPI0016858BB0|nr:hypothetical protein [Pseudanabaena sp. FACHB-2040]MBD2259416.1 hypothetical protein [Pseudanabaena sp. FACHB-2040]